MLLTLEVRSVLMLLWAPKVFTDLAEALSEGCVGSPLHHFSLFSLLLPLIALQPLDFGHPDVCAGYFILFLCVPPYIIFSLSLRRPILLRGLRVGPVAWPWRPGSSSGLPPRPYVAEPLTNGLV